MRPTAEDRFNTASRREARRADAWREVAYKGMKNGGTRRGKVPKPDPRKRRINLVSKNIRLENVLTSDVSVKTKVTYQSI